MHKTLRTILLLGLLILLSLMGFFGYWLYTRITANSLLPYFKQNRHQINAAVAEKNLKTHVATLANISPPRNHHNLESLNQAALYIESEFNQYCPQVKRQTFIVSKFEYSNIVCLFGEEKDLIIVGAHYDVDGQSVGADDNASGVAGLIELARLLKIQPSKQNVEIVAYTLEELPHFRTENMGSFQHAKYLADSNVAVKYMISLEMIGYFSTEENSQKIPSRLLKFLYPSMGNFISLIGRFNQDTFITNLNKTIKETTDMPVRAFHAPEYMLEGHSSDQLNYWKFGFDAAIVTDTGPFRNPHYHKPSDTPETLDYPRFAKVVTGVYAFLQN